MKSDAKLARQRAIRNLVATGNMHTQEDLVEALREEGTTVTQATISRDIVEIGLVRAIQGGKVVYTLPEAVQPSDSFHARRRLAGLVREVPLAFGDSSPFSWCVPRPGVANLSAAPWTRVPLTRWWVRWQATTPSLSPYGRPPTGNGCAVI